MLPRGSRAVFSSFAVLAFLTFASAGHQDPAGEQVVLLMAPSSCDFQAWRAELEAKGLFMRHVFPPSGGIAVLDPAIQESDLRDAVPSGTEVYLSPPEGADAEGLLSTSQGQALSFAFRHLAEPRTARDGRRPASRLVSDALTGPLFAREGACNSGSLYLTTSEYLLGSSTVTIILPESVGAASTKDWTAAMENNVLAEIVQGLNSLSTLYGGTLASALRPSFTYSPAILGRTDPRAQITVEPINGPHPVLETPLWVDTIYDQLGYSTQSSTWFQGGFLNGDQRAAKGTKWAFTIFVVNSLGTSGSFTDGWDGYAYLGGPFIMMTYDNGGWGIDNMDMVTRHETGHIFHALDEYLEAPCACNESSGYVRYYNDNCELSCSMNVGCMMRDNVALSCSETRGMAGWGDRDADLIPDPVDVGPGISLTPYSPNPTTNCNLRLRGVAWAGTLANQNTSGYMCDISVLAITNVQYRVDSGSWLDANPLDGAFDSGMESYGFAPGPLATGVHRIETRSIDSLGQVNGSPATDTVSCVSVLPGPRTIVPTVQMEMEGDSGGTRAVPPSPPR
jgi:hypothetical protein